MGSKNSRISDKSLGIEEEGEETESMYTYLNWLILMRKLELNKN